MFKQAPLVFNQQIWLGLSTALLYTTIKVYNIIECLLQRLAMNMQSPTTLLSSIQFMRSKLRNDKQTLMDIKNDFTRFNKKSVPCVSQEEQSFVLADISQIELNRQGRKSNSIDKVSRNRINELKKAHHWEMVRLKEEHEKEMTELLRIKDLEIEDIENKWRAKLEEQTTYIASLEEAGSSPIQSQRTVDHKEQYERQINKLLQNNTKLLDENTMLREQAEKWRKLSMQLDTERSTKNRFKFSKVKRDESQSYYQSQKSGISRNRGHSLFLFNDQNIDRSNLLSNKQWDDIEINDDQGKLKTIRQFEKQSHEERTSKRRELAQKSSKS